VTGSTVINETQRLETQSRSVRCLHAAADGSLVIGFAGWGLGRRHDGSYKRIEAAQGLPDDYVAQVLSDGKGGLWFTGNRGLFQVRLDELAAVAEGRERVCTASLTVGMRGCQAFRPSLTTVRPPGAERMGAFGFPPGTVCWSFRPGRFATIHRRRRCCLPKSRWMINWSRCGQPVAVESRR